MKSKIAFLSAGLGNISRGFEFSIANWYNQLKTTGKYQVNLYSGGKFSDATKVWNVPRNSKTATILRKIGIIKDGCRFEQISFAIGYFIHILTFNPDVIWFKEVTTGQFLLTYRKIFKFRYKLIFCDGAPVGFKVANQFDYVMFLHDYALEDALKGGIDPKKCIVMPNLTLFPDLHNLPNNFRQAHQILPNKIVIICVAAWNRYHKRIDYIIEEVARLKNPNITIVFCGQPEKETQLLMDMAKAKKIDTRWLTLKPKELSQAYLASDIFVLASLNEGLATVIIEAAAHKLPVICHFHEGGKFVFGENFDGLTDLSVAGNLGRKINSLLLENDLRRRGQMAYSIVEKKFNRNELTQKHIQFIDYVIKGHS